jgi:hypothetical protein
MAAVGAVCAALIVTGVPAVAVPSPDAAAAPVADGPVYAVVYSRGVMYIGGRFTSVNGLPRRNLAAIDLQTGRLTRWAPQTNGTVRALARGRRGTIIAGGIFTRVKGAQRQGLARIGPKGKLWKWAPVVGNGTVDAILVRDRRVYVGGTFTSLNGERRSSLGALPVKGGRRTLEWGRQGVDGRVRDLTFARNGRVIVAGKYRKVGNKRRWGLAILHPSTGRLGPYRSQARRAVWQVIVRPKSLLLAGGGRGGAVVALDRRGRVRWTVVGDGDVEALAYNRSREPHVLYVGGHFGRLGGQERIKLAAVDLRGGKLRAWRPDRIRGGRGVRGMLRTANGLYVAGDFTLVGGRDHPGLVFYPD